jgi:Peptidase family S41
MKHILRHLAFLLCLLPIVSARAQTEKIPTTEGRPRLTSAQWREDLQFAIDTFLERDRSFSPEARQRFRETLNNLQARLQSKSDEQIIVELAKAIALAGNAHTRLYILRNRSELRRYPIRVWWFADGLYVVRATPEYSELLGRKVFRIAGRTVEQVKEAVDPLFAGNAQWLKYMSAYTMTSPDILIGLGLISPDGIAEIEFVGPAGKRKIRKLSPLPLRRSDQPVESWWDLAPARPRNDGMWLSALSAGSGLMPLYLRNTEKQYWFEYIPQQHLLYIQFNRSGDAPTGTKFAEFGKTVLADLQVSSVKKIVVDMRFNTGGNLDIAKSFFESLAELANQRKNKLYVITGRATFSAGLFHALQLRRYANATLVGEPIGDGLTFWSEGGNVIAPNSKLSLHYADRMHNYSSVDRPEFKQYLVSVPELRITDPGPDMLVTMSAMDYFAGRDPAMEVMLRDRKP